MADGGESEPIYFIKPLTLIPEKITHMENLQAEYWHKFDTNETTLTFNQWVPRDHHESGLVKEFQTFQSNRPTSGFFITTTLPATELFPKPCPSLLLVKTYGCEVYGLPKGKVKLDETYLEAALRETHEETGLNLTPLLPSPLSSLPYHKQKHQLLFYLNLSPTHTPPDLATKHSTHETLKVKWFSLASLRVPAVRKQVSRQVTDALKAFDKQLKDFYTPLSK